MGGCSPAGAPAARYENRGKIRSLRKRESSSIAATSTTRTRSLRIAAGAWGSGLAITPIKHSAAGGSGRISSIFTGVWGLSSTNRLTSRTEWINIGI